MIGQLVINSKDRSTGLSTSSTNFAIVYNQLIEGHKCLTLNNVEIPNEIYNVTGANNNIDFNDGSANVTATLTPGCYSLSGGSTSGGLLSTLGTAMTAASVGHGGLTFTATYSATTHLITISAGGAFTLRFASGANSGTSAAGLLGFAQADTGSATSQTGASSPSLIQPYYLLISVKGLITGISSSSNSFFTFTVPVTGNSGDLISYNRKSHWEQRVAISQPFNTLEVQLKIDGAVANLNGADWGFVLLVE